MGQDDYTMPILIAGIVACVMKFTLYMLTAIALQKYILIKNVRIPAPPAMPFGLTSIVAPRCESVSEPFGS